MKKFRCKVCKAEFEAENAAVDKIEDVTGADIIILNVSTPESFLGGVTEEVISKILF